MPISLTGKIVLITGASSGIGMSCAHYFAEAGAHVILSARRKEKLLSLANELQQKYPTKTLLLPLDVQKVDAISTTIQGLPADWQAIDILINNAGLSRGLDKQYEAPLQDWD